MTDTHFNTLVFDVGGSHATASLICDFSFELRHTADTPLPPDASKDELLGHIEDLARSVLNGAGISTRELSGVGFAIPGPFDYELGVSRMRHKHSALYGVSVRDKISSRLCVVPEAVTFINDAAAFLLGEITAGVARKSRRVVGMTLGTGVGSAFAVDGTIVTSGPGVPPGGEIWNLPWGNGTYEDVISTRAIQAIYRALSGTTLEVKEVAHRTSTDDAAVETFRRFGRDLGAVIKFLSGSFGPDTVVIGGAIARSAELFLPAAKAELGSYETEIVVSKLFENAALVGAGANWLKRTKTVLRP